MVKGPIYCQETNKGHMLYPATYLNPYENQGQDQPFKLLGEDNGTTNPYEQEELILLAPEDVQALEEEVIQCSKQFQQAFLLSGNSWG